jgi:hypothetical protein
MSVPRNQWIVLDPPEKLREYVYPDGEALSYTNVTRLKVNDEGMHYIDHEDGRDIIAPGWRAVHLEVDRWSV